MYRWVEHTGELELEIEAPTQAAVFADALVALTEAMREGDAKDGPVTREIRLEAADRATLLADWLSELAFIGETEGFVAERLTELELGDAGLRATVEGGHGRPRPLIKGVTYHRLAFTPAGEGWRATVVLDV